MCVPIATQCGHAVRAAALKIRHQPQAVLCTQDGATSKGDFSEASESGAPGICRWCLSSITTNGRFLVPRAAQCGAPTRWPKKGWGAGIHSVQADGNDIIAMLEVVNEALDRARHRKGPTLIERPSATVWGITPPPTMPAVIVPQMMYKLPGEREPPLRLCRLLTSQGAWSEAMDARWQEHCQALISKAAEQYLANPAAGRRSDV